MAAVPIFRTVRPWEDAENAMRDIVHAVSAYPRIVAAGVVASAALYIYVSGTVWGTREGVYGWMVSVSIVHAPTSSARHSLVLHAVCDCVRDHSPADASCTIQAHAYCIVQSPLILVYIPTRS